MSGVAVDWRRPQKLHWKEFEYKGTAGTGRNVDSISASVHPGIVGVQQEPRIRLPERQR